MILQLGSVSRGRLGVLARWSSMVFKGSTRRAREVGEILGVDYLVEGSVRREGDRVRITARLVETASETHLWSDAYERELTDCLAVQTDVAARIARSLAMELTPPSERPAACDALAYQTYLKGRYYWNKPFDEGVNEGNRVPRARARVVAIVRRGARGDGTRAGVPGRVLPRTSTSGAEGGGCVSLTRACARCHSV